MLLRILVWVERPELCQASEPIRGRGLERLNCSRPGLSVVLRDAVAVEGRWTLDAGRPELEDCGRAEELLVFLDGALTLPGLLDRLPELRAEGGMACCWRCTSACCCWICRCICCICCICNEARNGQTLRPRCAWLTPVRLRSNAPARARRKFMRPLHGDRVRQMGESADALEAINNLPRRGSWCNQILRYDRTPRNPRPPVPDQGFHHPFQTFQPNQGFRCPTRASGAQPGLPVPNQGFRCPTRASGAQPGLPPFDGRPVGAQRLPLSPNGAFVNSQGREPLVREAVFPLSSAFEPQRGGRQ